MVVTECGRQIADRFLVPRPAELPLPELRLPIDNGRERKIKPHPPEHFHVVGKGIDLQHQYAQSTHDFGYEDACFEEIARHAEGKHTIILGPHLIDAFLPLGFHGAAIPDAIALQTGQQKVWVLRELFEMKSGSHMEPKRKLLGFKKLLNDMRADSRYLPNMLQHLMPWAGNLPERIVIPDYREVHVTFVSPRLRYHVLYDRKIPFRVSHLRVKPAA